VCYLKPIDSQEVHLRKLSSVKVFVDIHRSELIQFIRPCCDGKVVGMGRLYYHDNYGIYGNNQLKSEEFRKWASKVFRVAKKTLVREPINGIYFGKEAEALIASGAVTIKY